MGRPSHFVASTSRVTAKDIQEYIIWHAKNGKVLDLYCIDRESVLRWLYLHRPYTNRNGDIVSTKREERAGIEADNLIVSDDVKPHDSHVKLYYQERTKAILSGKTRPAAPEINWAALHAKDAAKPRAPRPPEAPAKPRKPAKPKGPRAEMANVLKNAIEGLKNGGALNVEALTRAVNKAAGK